MSISALLQAYSREGRLFKVDPFYRGTYSRGFYVTEPINQLLEGNFPEYMTRGAALLADISSIAGGHNVSMCFIPYEAEGADFGLLNPPADGVWDFRSRDPEPAIRLLGGFANKDLFIALTWRWRANLGDRYSQAWRDAIVETTTEWRNMFPAINRITGDQVSDFFEYNANDKDKE